MILGNYVDWATQRAGPQNKIYPEQNARFGWVCHSMEGWWATNDTLDAPKRGSWHLTILTDGKLLQHYSLSASPWASGNKQANTGYVAIELEGLVGTPMNNAQLASAWRLYQDWRKAGLPVLTRGENLFDHNEVATRWKPNSGPTACPSNRWAPFHAWLAKTQAEEEEENMALTEEQVRKIAREEARAELEAQATAAGASNLREFVRFVSARFFAMNRATAGMDGSLGRINQATDPAASIEQIEKVGNP